MRRAAAAMGCEFVYAVVPPAPVLDVLRVQATKQARVELARATEQMSLDGQVLTPEQMDLETERLALEKLVNLSPRLWEEP
jgi:hypothetical protein